MVTVRIIIEGGAMPNSNTNAQTINNSEKLREAFHTLFSQIIDPEKFNLEIEMGAGEKNAVKIFKKHIENNKSCLLIDLDGLEESKEDKIQYLDIEDLTDFVFFMIQRMESWILSQPSCIEKGMEMYNRKRVNEDFSEYSVFQQDFVKINNPERELNTILSRYYFYKKREITKKCKYGKLKNSYRFIKNMSAEELISSFKDAKLLFEYINN